MVKSILTIDDAPSNFFREKLNFLFDSKIPAIFFVKGENIKDREDWLVESVKKGYVLGNHTHSHKRASQLSLDELNLEIEYCEAVIEKIYKNAGIKRPVKLFRFPYGDDGTKYREQIQELLKEFKFVNPLLNHLPDHSRRYDTSWTFNTKDWALGTGRIEGLNTLDDLKKRLEVISRQDSLDVVVMHDHDHTNDLFPEVVKHLQILGAEFYLPNF